VTAAFSISTASAGKLEMKRIAALAILLTGIASSPAVPRGANGHDRIARGALDRESLCGIGRGRDCSIKVAIARGMFQTGLRPHFAADARCREIDEHWAIDYTYKRDREAYHGGIDMPAAFGTPILAAAAGTVVGIYSAGDNSRGIQVILRHTPQDTGIPLWIYTVYAHLQKMPNLNIGDRLGMGDVIGPTGNTGRLGVHKGGRGDGSGGGEGRRGRGGAGRADADNRSHRHHAARRPAVHFAVYFSASPKYAALRQIVIPADGYWMDPVALFRAKPPFDSKSMRALPAADKRIPIPYMLADGTAHPKGTKLIWPYACTRR
jgi:Peptidase family M23